MYKILFYIPIDEAEKVKKAMFDAGAGRIGAYSHCCWQTEGQGQFLPMDGSQPTIGEQGRLKKLNELKVEMVCAESCIKQVVEALVSAHPYEEPAYGCWKIFSLEDILHTDADFVPLA